MYWAPSTVYYQLKSLEQYNYTSPLACCNISMTLGPRQTAVSETAAKWIQDQLSLQADLVSDLFINSAFVYLQSD